MSYFTVFPAWNYSTKQIEIKDADHRKVGLIQRKYKNLGDKLFHYSPITISFLEKIHIDGQDNDVHLKIRERSFKENLRKLKWDVFLQESTEESQFLLEDKTKIATNPRIVYHKNNQAYLFKKDPFNRTCEISVNGNICATIKIEKLMPLSVKTEMKTNDFKIIELLAIYFVMILVY